MMRSKRLALLLLIPILGLLTVQQIAGATPPPPVIEILETPRAEGALEPCYDGCGGVYDVPPGNADYEQELVELINAERTTEGVPPLKRVPELMDASRYHAKDMGDDNYFSHSTFDRTLLWLTEVCSWTLRLDTYYPSYLSLGEIIAGRAATPSDALNVWLNSAPHRDLLLHPAFQELGTGYYDAAGADVPYWVTDFGRRSGVYPVIIDGEAATTVSRTVSLYVYGTGIWSEMRLRNNAGAWTGWQPFQSTLDWTLPNTAGEHAVWVEMRDTGSSTVSSDTIELTQSFLPTLGNVPDELAFTYDKAAGTVSPIVAQVTPANVGDSQNLTWTLSAEGTWFSLTPMNGTTPDTFSIAPQPSDLSTLPAGTYTGAVTVTVTDPADTQDTPQRIDLTVEVQAPALGGLPDSVTFNYYMPESLLLPDSVTLTPENTGSDDTINWTLSKVGSWFTASPTSGSTPGGSFTLTPSSFNPSTVQTYTGEITVTATSPSGTENSPHSITVRLRVMDTAPGQIFLPTIMRFYTPPIPLLYPNDTYYSSQWGLAKMNAPLAWGSTLGDNVLIAVLDSGADFSHPDLQSKLRSDIDWDYVNDDGTAQDDNGHGTHVSGIAAAVTDNNQGVAGLGWNSTILPLKVLDNRGDGDLQALLDAIYDATDQGVKVINMSLGSDPTAQELVCEVDTPSLAEAFQYAYDHGVVSVVSAGNEDGYDAGRVVPASCPYVLTVGATTSSDTRASFSNVGSVLDIAAPGLNIYSTYWTTDYSYKSGTSMSAPYVSGLAALVWAQYPTYTPDQVAAAILDNAADIGSSGWDQEFGCGRIDAGLSVTNGTPNSVSQCKPSALTGTSLAAADVVGLEPPAPESYAPGQIIVKLRPGISAQATWLQSYRLEAQRELRGGSWIMELPEGMEWETAQRLVAEGVAEYAHPNYYISAH